MSTTFETAAAQIADLFNLERRLPLTPVELFGESEQHKPRYQVRFFDWTKLPEPYRDDLMKTALYLFQKSAGFVEKAEGKLRWVSEELIPFGVVGDEGLVVGVLFLSLGDGDGTTCPVKVYGTGRPASSTRLLADSISEFRKRARIG